MLSVCQTLRFAPPFCTKRASRRGSEMAPGARKLRLRTRILVVVVDSPGARARRHSRRLAGGCSGAKAIPDDSLGARARMQFPTTRWELGRGGNSRRLTGSCGGNSRRLAGSCGCNSRRLAGAARTRWQFPTTRWELGRGRNSRRLAGSSDAMAIPDDSLRQRWGHAGISME